MTAALFVLAVLGQWSYQGGALPQAERLPPAPAKPDRPAEPRTAKARTLPPDTAPTSGPAPVASDRFSATLPPPAVREPLPDRWAPDPGANPPVPPAPGPPPAAEVWYELADAAGAVWRHNDPAFLSAWVAQRNAAIAAAQSYTITIFCVPAPAF